MKRCSIKSYLSLSPTRCLRLHLRHLLRIKEETRLRNGIEWSGMEMQDCVIIGGGAAGMAAAIAAKRSGAQSVLLIEKNDSLGKKLKQTGNGRCNFTNRNMQASCFRSESPSFIEAFLKEFSYEDSLRFFHSVGVLEKLRGDYVYPHSDQAKSLVFSLENAMRELGVERMCSTEVKAIRNSGNKEKPLFEISCCTEEELKKEKALKPGKAFGKEKFLKDDKVFKAEKNLKQERTFKIQAKKLLLCTGGLAMPSSGSTGEGYRFAEALGHTVLSPFPSLCPIYTEEKFVKAWAGVRVDTELSLFEGEKLLFRDRGELQCTEYGISGIVVFQCSRLVHELLEKNGKAMLSLSFFPEFKEEEFLSFLLKRKEERSAQYGRDFLLALLPDKLVSVLFQKAQFPVEKTLSEISKEKIRELCSLLFHFSFKASKIADFTKAQCTAGGVSVSEVYPETMESKLCPNLYFAGEILDVDGLCGGYNLHFAFGSGILSGRAMGRRND